MKLKIALTALAAAIAAASGSAFADKSLEPTRVTAA